jgi:hypothetical protein
MLFYPFDLIPRIKRLVARFLRESWRRGQWRQRSETRGGFLLSGEAFVPKLSPRETLERRCSRDGGEALLLGGRRRGAGESGCSWMRQKTAGCRAHVLQRRDGQ